MYVPCCCSGKELKALMKKQLEGENEEEEPEEGQDESFSSPEKYAFKKSEGKRPPSPVKGEAESKLYLCESIRECSC